jgi:hypothetical protein
MSHIHEACWAPELRARILHRTELHYAAGADAALDRPGHVRAASSIARFGGRLAIVQDDANFVALLDPRDKLVHDLALPAGKGGKRLFDKGRDNKKHKLDLEACCAVQGVGGDRLLAFGSGSRSVREAVALVEQATDGSYSTRVVRLPRLYEALRAHPLFATSELNLEGAVWLGSHVRLFQRSNGQANAGAEPLCATCDLAWPRLEALLADPKGAPVPALERVRQYRLGAIDGVRLTFTDACLMHDERILFVASAEASPDAFHDGEVRGSTLGVIDADGNARLCALLDERGEPCRDKVEGITLADEPGLAYAVCDPDDYERAGEIATLALDGTW